MARNLLAALAEFLPPGRLITGDARLDGYRHDQALLVEAGAPIGAALPIGTGEVSRAFRTPTSGDMSPRS